ncbi:MAG: S41 family peptidase [Marinifilaceae bacterium]
MNLKKILTGAFLLGLAYFGQAQSNPLWMRYPAISPDGQTIVFEYKGDLYKVAAQGGEAKIMTTNAAYDFQPVWSPDGKQIAFASDRFGNFDIYTMSAEGGPARRITTFSGNEIPNSFNPDGKEILFSAHIMDDVNNVQFPSGVLTELYSVSIEGGRPKQVLTTPAVHGVFDKNQKHILYEDRVGYEDYWRKHHTSSTTRDIWIYDVDSREHKKISAFEGEDLFPVYNADQSRVLYVTEQFGDANVCMVNPQSPDKVEQITFHKKHPVRFLTIDSKDKICYGFNGEIFTKEKGQEPQKVNITLRADVTQNPKDFMSLRSGATEMEVSPNGKEIAFILRGEVFVTSVDYSTTKRITNTPEQERSVSWSPDSKSVLYASERNNSWNIYQTKRVRKEETNFANATLLKEEPVVVTDQETFQPTFSPDGKEVAYLENRTTLKVINLKSKKTRTILDGKHNYSYADGDQWYQWSPDGKWFLVNYFGHKRWSDEVGLVDAQGKQNIVNLTQSGYEDSRPKWMMKGKMMIWKSNREGVQRQGGGGSLSDIYAQFFTKEAFDRFKLSKEELELLKAKEKEEKKAKDKKKKEDADKKKKGKKKESKKDTLETLKIDLKNIRDRKVRLTLHSSYLADAIVTPDGEKLYYLCKFEKGYDLWETKLRDRSTRLVLKLSGYGGGIQMDKDGKNLFMFSGGQIIKVSTADNKKKTIAYKADFWLNKAAERDYMFEHAWRQTRDKFYVENMHGVDWDAYKKNYQRFLPHINNNYDYAEMMSEMLGELNASHTGCSYYSSSKNGDKTASLGVFFDENYTGKGLRIVEVIAKSPLDNSETKVIPGTIIEKLDGVEITPEMDYFPLLNHKAGKKVLLSLYNPSTKKRWEEIIKPISQRGLGELLYKRWVRHNEEETDRLSNSRLGYVHIRGMNGASYREIFANILGKYNDREALIIDTRFNGGGNLDEPLTIFLTGKQFAMSVPRGQEIGAEPSSRWNKPSVVLMCEANYSDAHCFPSNYKSLEIGKLVGTPVPGTCTAVWWEYLQDNSLIFGIPEVGMRDNEGDLMENKQLYPDVEIYNDFTKAAKGEDQQLEKTVSVMLGDLDKN